MKDLPAELIEIITSRTTPFDLMNLRLVSKAFNGAATRHLFSSLHVTPTESTQDAVLSILSTPKLAQEVRIIKITTCNRPNATSQDSETSTGDEDEESKFTPRFKAAMRSIGRFPNLRQVALEFSATCAMDDEYSTYGDASEDSEFRTEVLKTLFSSLNDPEHPALGVESLTLKNLQNVNDESVVSSEDFKSALSRLTELRLGIITEYIDSSPESSWLKTDMYKFFKELPSVWLRPASQITSLKLWSDVYWGYMPRCDLRSIHFSNLKKLELYNWSLSHDWQINWILSHGDTLEELTMQDCPIITHFRHLGDLDEEKYPIDPTRGDCNDDTWSYPRGWHENLTLLKTKLPHLKAFKIGDWFDSRDTGHFDGQPWVSVGMTKDRYIMLDGGVGPSPWNDFGDFSEWPYDDTPRPNPSLTDPEEANEEKDVEAYERLTRTVEQRAKK